MAKIPVVEADECTGCETCATICPEVFEMQDEKAVVVGPDKCDTCDCEEAIDTCPVECISWSE